jgi:formimidoylglutamate deiminase
MTRQYRIDAALGAEGWMRNVLVTVSDAGLITKLEPESAQEGAPAAERLAGFVVPGMANAHSHAFQRAMAGSTEYRATSKDSFWTWRQAMYALANRIEPDELQSIATQLFVEMLKAGYTSVAEFHYLHRQRDASPYVGQNELWAAITHAADEAGIGLTLLPTLYQTSDFGGAPLRAEQARFALQTDEFLRAIGDRVEAERHDAAGPGRPSLARTGAAFHSLRAVGYDTLREATLALRAIDSALPIHIHVAEQLREVQACKQETGRRPIELLLESGLLTPRWCLVHATHATPEELHGIAKNGAAVCVSISTEANLGDGLFDAHRFLGSQGRLCIGSDSQITVDPSEELRWLEYQQRLRRKRRGVLATTEEPHVGTRLWRDAAIHGAAALGQPTGALTPGRRADWLVLDITHPTMLGAAPEAALDQLIFAGGRAAIRDYRHARQHEISASFAKGLLRLQGGH